MDIIMAASRRISNPALIKEHILDLPIAYNTVSQAYFWEGERKPLDFILIKVCETPIKAELCKKLGISPDKGTIADIQKTKLKSAIVALASEDSHKHVSDIEQALKDIYKAFPLGVMTSHDLASSLGYDKQFWLDSELRDLITRTMLSMGYENKQVKLSNGTRKLIWKHPHVKPKDLEIFI
jgi:hypothetical protein